MLAIDTPRMPRIVLNDAETPLIDGQNITLTCSANVGLPPTVRLTWTRKLPGRLTWLQLQNDSVDVTVTTDGSGASILVSRLKLALDPDDDEIVYRCLATNADATEISASYTLQVQCKKLSC